MCWAHALTAGRPQVSICVFEWSYLGVGVNQETQLHDAPCNDRRNSFQRPLLTEVKLESLTSLQKHFRTCQSEKELKFIMKRFLT